MTFLAPPLLHHGWMTASAAWDAADATARLWAGDATLWTGGDEAAWLGWLDLGDLDDARRSEVAAALAPILRQQASEVLLLGMGGSSLGAEVMAQVLARGPAGLPVRILDSLVPAAVAAAFDACDWSRTIVVVASKSGGTLEPAVLLAMASERLAAAAGADAPGRIIAITDPGSALEQEGHKRGFGAVILGRPAVGGRFSALTPFGLVPALLLDAPVAMLRERARTMADACRRPAADNPGVALGLALAAAAQAGRDKCTVLLPESLAPLGAWIEQLVAESTGKHGRMILPVTDEPVGPAAAYGDDRCFVHVRVPGEADPYAGRIVALREAGHPVFEVESEGAPGLWAEFFRWEFATAVAGAALGLHPFDQPDVEASKIATRALSEAWERDGVPAPGAVLGADDGSPALDTALRAWLGSRRPGDYIALLAWLPMTPMATAALTSLRGMLRDATGLATTVGFGPRYLHSTGQAFKGGPNTGLILSLTADDAADLAVPGRTLSLGAIARAQREGELAVLRARDRRVLEVSLGRDHVRGLAVLADVIRRVT